MHKAIGTEGFGEAMKILCLFMRRFSYLSGSRIPPTKRRECKDYFKTLSNPGIFIIVIHMTFYVQQMFFDNFRSSSLMFHFTDIHFLET
jgi:hypothetical protein